MKKPIVKKPATPGQKSKTKKPLLAKEPQSKQQAAVQARMFLYTSDAWSLAYFNQGDIHCMERELFG